jgi:glutamyl endopeptidase
LTVVLLVYGSVVTVQTTAAAASGRAPAIGGRAALDPNTSVASDGTMVTAPELSRHGVDGHRGTGVQNPTTGSVDNLNDPSGTGRESVIGTDERTQITDTTVYPYRAVVRITFSAGSCSGWLIGRNTVATAGHCVADGGTNTFYDPKSYRITPGQNGTTKPYGTCGATKLFSVTGWTSSGDEAFDYGAIKLSCNVGDTVGWFGFFWQSASLAGHDATVTGYPGDKPFGTDWTHTLSIAVSEDNQLFYQIDTAPGQSGSPVWSTTGFNCSGACGMAIHTYGVHGSTSPHSDNNHGTRITEARFNNLVTWRDAAAK